MATPKLSTEEREKRKRDRATKKSEPIREDSETGNEKEPGDQEETITFTIEEAPKETFDEEKKPGILESVLTRLGIKDDPKAPPIKTPTSAKLNGAQSQFCDMATPIAGSILIISLGWAWSQVDEDYRALAPSAEMAEGIAAPLIRIYARSNKALIRAASPNTVDALMCLNAVIMYAHASMTMLHQINITKKEEENDPNRPSSLHAGHGHNQAESRANHASVRRADFSRPDHGDVENATASPNIEYPDHLTERERQNYASLSELRERDIAARARRSGRYA